jgi:hypothetical protein
MALKQLIEERIDRLESVPDKLQSAIEKQDERLFKQILSDLGQLETKDGKIVASKSNLAKINGILENLKQTLFGSDYLDSIKEFAGEIATQAKLNNQIMEATVGSFNDDEMFKATVQSSQKNALLLMDESAVAHNFLTPLAEILTNSIVSNVSYTQAVQTLRENMVGENALLSRYAKVIIKDTFSVSDRQYNQLISKAHGIEFYRYDGGKIKTTRYFCCVRSNSIYHYKEISSWGSKPSLWNKGDASGCDKKQGGGMNPDTNSSTIFSYLGGYSCQHILVPIATEYVPENVKQDAIAKGYYKPD